MMYAYEVRFNGRLTGSGQTHSDMVEADSPIAALEHAIAAVVRLPQHGHSVYITGFTVDQQEEESDVSTGG
jgi:hypothetical protein